MYTDIALEHIQMIFACFIYFKNIATNASLTTRCHLNKHSVANANLQFSTVSEADVDSVTAVSFSEGFIRLISNL